MIANFGFFLTDERDLQNNWLAEDGRDKGLIESSKASKAVTAFDIGPRPSQS